MHSGYHTVKMVCKHCRFLYHQEQTAPQHLCIQRSSLNLLGGVGVGIRKGITLHHEKARAVSVNRLC